MKQLFDIIFDRRFFLFFFFFCGKEDVEMDHKVSCYKTRRRLL